MTAAYVNWKFDLSSEGDDLEFLSPLSRLKTHKKAIPDLLPTGCIITFTFQHEWITFTAVIVSETCESCDLEQTDLFILMRILLTSCYQFVGYQIM